MDKNRILPKIIRLEELPEEGRAFSYNQDSAELTSALSDLLGQRPYQVEFYLKPIGNAFEITGKINTSMALTCSRCAADLDYSMNEDINEILMVEAGRPRGSRSARPNHSSDWSDEGPYCNYLESSQFDVGAYIHELIATAEPLQPKLNEKCDTSECENYKKAVEMGYIQSAGSTEKIKESPFAVLERLKVPPGQQSQ